ncbi:MAG: hypothetical protein OEW56_07595, partial [Gemmatimonadota bacterium]|nr:hypothetical protein [Gemmatimonadota bacterium]
VPFQELIVRAISPSVPATLITLACLLGAQPLAAQSDSARVALAVVQLRSAVGAWSVVTEFLADDGSVGRTVTGEYVFEWVVPDRVVSGRSTIPALDQASGILFYVNARRMKIEMVSVGADGMLWIMTGDAGDEVRYTQEYDTADGKRGQLRFTRYNVTPDRFESRMEYTDDGGETWKPGNHQVFERKR